MTEVKKVYDEMNVKIKDLQDIEYKEFELNPGVTHLSEQLQEHGTESSFRSWGRPDQWRRFFMDKAVSRNIEDSMHIANPEAYITHGDCECLFPYMRPGGIRTFFMNLYLAANQKLTANSRVLGA